MFSMWMWAFFIIIPSLLSVKFGILLQIRYDIAPRAVIDDVMLQSELLCLCLLYEFILSNGFSMV
jgi:hypothetical protein